MPERRDRGKKPLLIEIGCEELPASQLARLSESLAASLRAGLAKWRFLATEERVSCLRTPRRIGVFIDHVSASPPPLRDLIPGPKKEDAFNDDRTPNEKAKGFARAHGVDVKDLIEKDGRLVCDKPRASPPPLERRLPDILEQAMKEATRMAGKTMRWGDKNQFHFVRPIRWLCVLHGDQVIDVELCGARSGRGTHGHRRVGNPPIELRDASCHEKELRKESNGGVIVDYGERKRIIQRQLDEALSGISGAAPLMGDDERASRQLETMTATTESPHALRASFDRRFLSLPKDVIVAVLKDGLNALTARDRRDGLLPHFIVVLDGRVKNIEPVRRAHERVVGARLNDAQFFFARDRRRSLAEHGAALDGLILQEELGHYADKTKRLRKLMRWLAPLFHIDDDDAERAAQLCKCDLLTDMVGEFPSLQGLVGSYYARRDGERELVVNAVGEHYRPAHADDALPASMGGLALALADKTDTLVGLLGLGHQASGSRDPYGLRRMAVGIARILFERDIDLDVKGLLRRARQNYDRPIQARADLAFDFLVERLEFCLRRCGRYDGGIVASLEPMRQSGHWAGLKRKLEALREFVARPEATELILAAKRIANIVAKNEAREQGILERVFRLPAEKDLYAAYRACAPRARQLNDDKEYRRALATLATLCSPINRFFDEVMVMSDKQAERNNRLALLAAIRDLFSRTADFSRIVPRATGGSAPPDVDANVRYAPTRP